MLPLGEPPWDPPVRLPPASIPSLADVAIVGAGMTGLSAAIALASKRHVIVIEHRFGSGATCRSGGIVLGETLVGPAPGFSGCEESLRSWIVEHEIECGLRWNGCLELSRRKTLSPGPIDWHDDGQVRFERRVNGGVLDPTRLLRGLAGALLRNGCALADGVGVESIEPAGDRVRLVTTGGDLWARDVVMAVDAMSGNPSADPWDERAFTVAMQTAPLEEIAIRAMGLGPDLPFYTSDLPLLWGRVMPDQSLLIGRELIREPTPDLPALFSDAGSRLAERVRRLHPALRDVGIRRVWAGPIARTRRGVPVVAQDARVSRLLWAGGYGGHGLAQAFRLGRVVATRLTT